MEGAQGFSHVTAEEFFCFAGVGIHGAEEKGAQHVAPHPYLVGGEAHGLQGT